MTTFTPAKNIELNDVRYINKTVPKLLITSNMDSYDSTGSFADACVSAYNHHNELILTPDSIYMLSRSL